MSDERKVHLFRNGSNQALRIPREFELPGTEAIVRREGFRLIVEPAPRQGLVAWLGTLEPLEDDFAPIADPPPQDDVDL